MLCLARPEEEEFALGGGKVVGLGGAGVAERGCETGTGGDD